MPIWLQPFTEGLIDDSNIEVVITEITPTISSTAGSDPEQTTKVAGGDLQLRNREEAPAASNSKKKREEATLEKPTCVHCVRTHITKVPNCEICTFTTCKMPTSTRRTCRGSTSPESVWREDHSRSPHSEH